MAEKFDIEERWPELFEQLDPTQRDAVRQSLAGIWHDGWIPNREDVQDLTDLTRGAIDREEYRDVGRSSERFAVGPGTRITDPAPRCRTPRAVSAVPARSR